ncbi:hypothetical protein ZTR_06607 [Talaromyces verruculosus]|nr:hypothetical protein ZTR_06607 [Talaromyces verruculosus]
MGCDTDGSTSMRLEQASGGLKGEPENRQLTWAEFEHNDTLFGPVIIRSHYISGTRYLDKGFRPIVELQTTAAGSDVRPFLTELIGTDLEAESEHMTVEKVFIHDFVRSANSGWTAEQIWALEIIGEEEFLTRRVVVVNNTSTELAHVLFRRE